MQEINSRVSAFIADTAKTSEYKRQAGPRPRRREKDRR